MRHRIVCFRLECHHVDLLWQHSNYQAVTGKQRLLHVHQTGKHEDQWQSRWARPWIRASRRCNPFRRHRRSEKVLVKSWWQTCEQSSHLFLHPSMPNTCTTSAKSHFCAPRAVPQRYASRSIRSHGATFLRSISQHQVEKPGKQNDTQGLNISEQYLNVMGIFVYDAKWQKGIVEREEFRPAGNEEGLGTLSSSFEIPRLSLPPLPGLLQ